MIVGKSTLKIVKCPHLSARQRYKFVYPQFPAELCRDMHADMLSNTFAANYTPSLTNRRNSVANHG